MAAVASRRQKPIPLDKSNIVSTAPTHGSQVGALHQQTQLLPPNTSSFSGPQHINSETPTHSIASTGTGRPPSAGMRTPSATPTPSKSRRPVSAALPSRYRGGKKNLPSSDGREQRGVGNTPSSLLASSYQAGTGQLLDEEYVYRGGVLGNQEVGFLTDQPGVGPSSAGQGFLSRVGLNDDDFKDDWAALKTIEDLDNLSITRPKSAAQKRAMEAALNTIPEVKLKRPMSAATRGDPRPSSASIGPSFAGSARSTTVASPVDDPKSRLHDCPPQHPSTTTARPQSALERWSVDRSLDSRIKQQQRSSRPSSALSSTTVGIDSLASDLWEQIEQKERDRYYEGQQTSRSSAVKGKLSNQRKSKGMGSQAQTPSSTFLTRTTLHQQASPPPKAVSPISKEDGMEFSAITGGGTSAVRSLKGFGLNESRTDRDKEESKQAWERLWRPRHGGRLIPVSRKRPGEGVQQKIDALRKDPEARRALNSRLKREEEEQRKIDIEEKGDLKKRNMETVSKYAAYFAQARAATAAVRLQNALEAAKHKRQGLQSWRMARTVDQLQKVEFQRRARANALEFEMLSNSWATFVMLAVSCCELHDRMVDRMRMIRYPGIKRFTFRGAPFLENLNQRQTLRLVKASKVIWCIWLMKRPMLRARRKRTAVLLIYKFLSDIGDTIRIPLAVKKKLKVVRLLQRAMRFRAISLQARAKLCLSQVEVSTKSLIVEDEREISRLKSSHLQYERDIMSKKGIHRLAKTDMVLEHRQNVDKQIIALVQRQQTIQKMPMELKKELTMNFLIKKRSDYNNQVHRYGQALRGYYRDLTRLAQPSSLESTLRPSDTPGAIPAGAGSHEERRKSLASSAEVPRGFSLTKPIKPHFTTLFTKDEITKLVGAATDVLMKEEAHRQKQQREIEEAEAKKVASEKVLK